MLRFGLLRRSALPAALVALAVAMGCERGAPGRRALAPPPASVVDSPAYSGLFSAVTRQAGIATKILCGGSEKDHILESTGSGCAFVDLDGDALPDIYLVNAWSLDEDPSGVRRRGRNALYRNRGGLAFEDVSAGSGADDDGWGSGVCAGDVDGDGDLDLYVTNFGANKLLINRGDMRFEDATERAGVGDEGWGAGCALFDADGDGDLDLYVANYIDCTMDEVLAARRTSRWRDTTLTMAGPFGLRGGRDVFYRNRGDGTFEDATDEAGLTDEAEAYGLGVLAGDLDLDGDVDLYVANDSNPNYLYRNEGDGTFTDVGGWCGAGYDRDGAAQAGMGVDAGDFDGDGQEDLVVTNFTRDHSTVYRQVDDLFFEDVSREVGVFEPSQLPLSWGCAFFDLELDGDLDLLIVNGHIYPQVDRFPALEESYAQEPLLLRGEAGRFTPVPRTEAGALAKPIPGRGLALADGDGDGDLDLLISGVDALPRLLRNDAPRSGHFLRVRVLDERGAPAVGARIEVLAAGHRQRRELRSGSTYQSQSSFVAHFGLGAATGVERLVVTWPDGRTTTASEVPADALRLVRRTADR